MSDHSLEFVGQIPLGNLNKEQFLGIAHEVVKNFLWNIIKFDENGFVAGTNFSADEWQDDLSVTIENDKAILKTRIPQFENATEDNGGSLIEQFTTSFNALKDNQTAEETVTLGNQWKKFIALS